MMPTHALAEDGPGFQPSPRLGEGLECRPTRTEVAHQSRTTCPCRLAEFTPPAPAARQSSR
ncbi:hypothetical protein [Brevibacterium spongiae]|uniref:Uncharacterized protein n=1 Tax=Brevibacterium spongiae TaxID=2909672 RepID=A0ABY5SUR4_9MICO|nr:hypothetical protein [Brevibacterium spongiae]UVI36786.1 hypothetical protein L1F31_03755 [Brevibacterium spongiae]